MSNDSHAVNGVSFLNQACTHLFLQMVSKKHAGDLDLFDRGRTRRHGFRWWLSQINCRHILPATSNNRVSRTKSAGMDARGPHTGCVRSQVRS